MHSQLNHAFGYFLNLFIIIIIIISKQVYMVKKAARVE